MTALLPITDEQAHHWRTVMAEHANRERYGCRICRRPDCTPHHDARVYLSMGGLVDYDPIRDRATGSPARTAPLPG